MTKKPAVTMYSDGACKGNPGPGGWGVVLVYGKHQRQLSGAELDTTNNQMELRAVLEGLSALRRPCDVTVITDSRNVIGWLSQGWRRRNPDVARLCAEIEDVIRQGGHTVRFRWVKGHAGEPLNERADWLASSAAEAAGDELLRRAINELDAVVKPA